MGYPLFNLDAAPVVHYLFGDEGPRVPGRNSGVHMKKILLASVGTLALCAAVSTSAVADVNGDAYASYSNITNSGGGDIWGVGGALEGMFSNHWGAQVDGAYHSESGGGSDIWSIGGSVFWASMQGRFGATVDYHDLGGGANFTAYGAGAEFYAGPNFTIAAHGGGESGSGQSGGYVGGQAEWYVIPNLALSGSVDYLDVGPGITSESIQAEWLFSNSMPLSLYGGYQHVDLNSGPGSQADIVFVGVKLYFNGNGAATLVDRQRKGSLGYITQSPLFIDQH